MVYGKIYWPPADLRTFGNLANTRKRQNIRSRNQPFVYTHKLTILPQNIFSKGRQCLHEKVFFKSNTKSTMALKRAQQHNIVVYFLGG
jgi:hypothetical protein